MVREILECMLEVALQVLGHFDKATVVILSNFGSILARKCDFTNATLLCTWYEIQFAILRLLALIAVCRLISLTRFRVVSVGVF